MRHSPARLGVMVAALGVLLACPATDRPPGIRMTSTTFLFRASSEPMPPRARERTMFRVVIRDRETGEPVETGEGRIFASTIDGAQTWDILVPGDELGTYYGHLNFIIAGEWAVALQFRRSEEEPLERVDWMQEVLSAREEP
jgi:hypothetical protein